MARRSRDPNEVQYGTMDVVLTNHQDLINQFNLMPTQAKKVVNRTVGDFKSRGPGWVSQEVCKEYNIKKKDVNEAKKGIKKGGSAVRVRGQRLDSLALEYKGKLLTPTHFQMRPGKRPIRNRPYTITAQFKKDGGRRSLSRKAFLAPSGADGTKQIPFQRKGDKRLPISAIKTVSVPQMITNESVSEQIHNRVNEELGKRMDHHLQRILNPSG